jgi:DNA repair exonuclease SbcCD ATPase subunit
MENVKQKINQLAYEIGANLNVLNKTRQDLKDCEDKISLLFLSGEVLKVIGDRKKQQTIEIFERVVTSAISEVFGFNYKFVIDLDSSGKRVTTKFKLVNAEGNELDIMGSCGGGLIDIISLVLRVLILVSAKPKRNRVLFLDESLKHLSADYRPKAATLLKSLSKQLGIQIFLVSHQQEMLETADIAYELVKTNDGVTARRL